MRSNCNNCCTRRCQKIKSEYPKFRTKHKLSQAELAFNKCPSYIPPNLFKMPILMHLLTSDKKIQAASEILQKHGFVVEEKSKYPYFRMRLK